jgi:hypothetical protein
MTGSILRFTRQGLLAVLIACAPLAAFALTTDDLAPLAADDFDAKSAAIDKLIATADAPSVAVLNALSDGSLVATDSGKVLIQTDDGNKDPLTDKKVDAPDAQPVTLNNLLRSKVSGALSGLELSSPDIEKRRAAIDELLKEADPSIKPLVDKARAKETDPTLKKRLDTLWATTALHDADPAKRLEAVQLVAARHDLDMNELLRPIVAKKADGTFNEPDAKVRAAAQAGIAELDSIQRRGLIAGTIFAGLSLGSVLLLAALGLAITYGLIGVINMAHGEFLMIGAYATYVVQNLVQHYAPGAFDWYPLFAVPVSFAAAAAAGAQASLRTSARNPADHLRHQPDPDPGHAHDLRRAERAGDQPLVDERRRLRHAEPDPAVQPPDHPRLLAGGGADCVARADQDAAWPLRARGHAEPTDGSMRRREDRARGFVCLRVRRGHRGPGRLRALADRQHRAGSRAELHHRFIHDSRARRRRATGGDGNRRLRARARQQDHRTILGRGAREDRGAGADRAVHPEAASRHVRLEGPQRGGLR